jgi:hypothetical protein
MAIAAIAFAALTVGGVMTGLALVLVPIYVIGLERRARQRRTAGRAAARQVTRG